MLISAGFYGTAQESNKIVSDSVRIETSNGIIFGILFSPENLTGKVPAILCLQGGGDVGLSNYTFEPKFFARNGMVSLVCDKSGSGLSRTAKSWEEQTFVEKTAEYAELLDWLAKHPKTDTESIGVHGMSEGGRLALNLAIEYPEKLAFVNSVSGPIASFKDNQLYAIYHHLHSQNFDFPIIVEALSVWNDYFDEIGKGKISQQTTDRVNILRLKAPDLRYLPGNTTELPSRPLPQDIHFSTEEKVNQIKCPVLFQFGERDGRVDPLKSLSLIDQKENFKIKNYKNADHNMTLENGNIHPLFLQDKKEWLTKILKNL